MKRERASRRSRTAIIGLLSIAASTERSPPRRFTSSTFRLCLTQPKDLRRLDRLATPWPRRRGVSSLPGPDPTGSARVWQCLDRSGIKLGRELLWSVSHHYGAEDRAMPLAVLITTIRRAAGAIRTMQRPTASGVRSSICGAPTRPASLTDLSDVVEALLNRRSSLSSVVTLPSAVAACTRPGRAGLSDRPHS